MSARAVHFVLFVLLSSCAQHRPDAISEEEPSSHVWRYRFEAADGDPTALHKVFAATYAQVMMSSVNGGEDAESIRESISSILSTTGDSIFSTALKRESHKVQSAVREFLFPSIKTDYPETYTILLSAPTIDWPSDRAYRRSWESAGQTPPQKKQWQ